MEEEIGRAFMEGTQYRNLGRSDQERGLPQPPLQTALGGGEPMALPDPRELPYGNEALRDVIDRRASLRDYTDAALSLDELAYLLWCAQGVKRVVPGRATFRTVPSAGARHPFETVILANRIDGLPVGLYQYLAVEHRLAAIDADADTAERLVGACYGQAMVKTAAATFIWVADRYRMAWRYGERGIRYLHLDAGHICQNLYLAAESIGAGACAVAAFYDEQVNEILGLDGVDRFAVYLAPVGKRAAGDLDSAKAQS
jgi:SagB-type dehydrogenase family enzyme